MSTHDLILCIVAAFDVTRWVTQLATFHTVAARGKAATVHYPWVAAALLIVAVLW